MPTSVVDVFGVVGHCGLSDQRRSTLPWLARDVPEAEGIEDFRQRASQLFLAVGGAFTLTEAVLPGYLDRGWLARSVVLAVGVALLLSALIVRRWGVPTELVLFIAFLGDLSILVVMPTAARSIDELSNTMSLAVLSAFVAVFGRRRDLIGQAVFSNVVVLIVGPLAHRTWTGSLMFLLWSNFGLILPSIAMYVLRQQLIASTQFAHRLARTDPLTGVLNRRGLADESASILRLAASRDEGIGALACDLDHFKRLNDAYGHASGDEAITAVAAVLRRSVRAEDAVARLGGEEFAVVASVPRQELIALAERIRAEVAAACVKWQLTISIGVSWQPSHAGQGMDASPRSTDDRIARANAVTGDFAEKLVWSLLDDADEWAYRAKAQGRNRVEHTHAV
jgi:diguanylate cyclase (GGDEF)-like protein